MRYGSRPVAARPPASKKSAKTGSAAGWARIGQAVRTSSRWSDAGEEKVGARVVLELGSHRDEDLADEVFLRGEVVDDDPVADAEPLGNASERELAQPVVEGRGQRAVEDVGLGVLVTHRALIVVITSSTVS